MGKKQKEPPPQLLSLGTWLGRRQAFGLIASRCTATDAECLKAMRESGEYKKLGLTWEQFCQQHAGVSCVYADRLIRHLDEFGANYFRLAELIQISSDTYRLIAGSVADDGMEFGGEKIPLARENRRKLLGAVDALVGSEKRRRRRGLPRCAGTSTRLLADARAVAAKSSQREQVIAVLEQGREQLTELVERLRDPA
jgi:hypothetical protein